MNILRQLKQEWLDWCFTASPGEKCADVIVCIALVVIGLALLFAR